MSSKGAAFASARTFLKVAMLCLVIASGFAPSCSRAYSQSSPPAAGSQYFPTGIFRRPVISIHDVDTSAFVARWYSTCLSAMQEPSLLDAATDKSLITFRFLLLISQGRAIGVRIVIQPDGTAALTGKIVNWADDCAHGTMVRNHSSDVSQSQVREFQALFHKLPFWGLPTEESTSFIGEDGSQWIVEGVENGIYHVVDRWSPNENGDYAKMCLYLLNLSNIRLQGPMNR